MDSKNCIYAPGKVSRGRLVFSFPKTVEAALARFEGKEVMVKIDLPEASRSRAANNYYWGVLVHSLAEYTGYSKEEAHDLLKRRFADQPYYLVDNDTGEVMETITGVRSTKKMSKKEFAAYIDSCEELCINLGIQLPAFDGDRYANIDLR